MTGDRIRSIRRGAITLLVVATAYEAVARSGYFAPALMPPLGAVGRTLVTSILDGSMLLHAAATLYRVLIGFGLAVAVGLPLGVMMGRFRAVENFVLPLASALMPIPSLAWVPVFILWFGLGDTVTILIVFYAALFPMLLNTWTGVRAVNPIWLRAAGAMGADERALFWKVIIPGASPFIIAGLRQSFLRAWIAVIGAEMLAASDYGPRLGDFRRQGIPQHRRDAGVARRHRLHRLCHRAPGVRLDRARHDLSLGHGADGEGIQFTPALMSAALMIA